MEDALRDDENKKKYAGSLCLNPYSDGRCSKRGVSKFINGETIVS